MLGRFQSPATYPAIVPLSLRAVTHPTLDGCDAPGNRETENHWPQQQLSETVLVSSLLASRMELVLILDVFNHLLIEFGSKSSPSRMRIKSLTIPEL